jgi:ribose transport system ATP-binding protein
LGNSAIQPVGVEKVAPAGVSSPSLVRVTGLRKHYGGVRALKGVDLDLRAGEIHGLVGANGAGKSTLIKILAGLEFPDAGEITVDGAPVTIATPDQATALGLSFIHQELNLVPRMSALQNIMLGVPKASSFGLVDWRKVRQLVQPIATRVGIRFSLETPAAELSVAERWLVSICRALVRRSRLIVMDEPTASLSAHECDNLFRIVRDLSSNGVAVLYVSHRLDEITGLCHRVTAFRDGLLAAQIDRASLNRARLVEAIVGTDKPEIFTAAAAVTSLGSDEIALSIRDLRRGSAVRGVSFDLHKGEVLGLGGLVGSGRSETVRLIFGADAVQGGEMTLYGRPFAPRTPHDAVEAGVGLVPEERRSEGLVLAKSVAFNLSLTSLRGLHVAPPLPIMSMRRRDRQAQEMSQRLLIKTPNVATPVGRLSGGNQQKVVIGKWLSRGLRVLILDEPSRGVDIGARQEIHRIIRELATQGVSIIVISSETEELPGLCDRVLVMVEGRITRELRGTAITREALVQASYLSTEESQTS